MRTQESLTEAPELDAIARVLHQQPSWRFELVVTNPRDRSVLPYKGAISLGQLDIAARLREARQLADQEHGEAALLLVWSATEALLRWIAVAEAITVTPDNPSQIVKSLFTYGVVDTNQYHVLQEGLQARTMVVHGYKEPRSLVATVDQLLKIAEQLQRDYQSP